MKSKSIKRILCSLFGLLLLFVAVFGGRGSLPAFAATIESTSALEDLKKSEDFNESDYPDDASGYSVQVIHIAEGADGSVFIYTYQPCQKTTYLVASGIEMSLTVSSLAAQLYGLTLLNADGVFCKYKVNDLTANYSEVNYYNVVRIHREYNKRIDSSETGNFSYNVGKLFIVNDIYTSAYDDMQRDENFSLENYPENARDYSISVIQIAEGTDGKLYIYTYQPCQRTTKLAANYVNMSLNESVDRTHIYSLTLVSSNGVICKYKVDALTVNSTQQTRYYNITSIYREYDRALDPADSIDNTTGKVSFAVGKVFVAQTVDGVPSYFEKKVDEVTITDRYVGNVMYEGETDIGWTITKNVTNVMYVAFNTDRDITKLFEADVQYSTTLSEYTVYSSPGKHWIWDLGKIEVNVGDPVPHDPVTLSYSKKDSIGNYSWYQIQSVTEFKEYFSKNDMELTTDAEAGLEGKKWVLCFAMVDVEAKIDAAWGTLVTSFFADDAEVRVTQVSDVSILRLKFEENGKLYNLGAVDNMTTGSNKPSNRLPGYDENNENYIGNGIGNGNSENFISKLLNKSGLSIPDWVWVLIGIAALVILLPILGVLIPKFGEFLLTVLKGVGMALLWLLKGLWWLICLPFRGIAALVRKCRGG